NRCASGLEDRGKPLAEADGLELAVLARATGATGAPRRDAWRHTLTPATARSTSPAAASHTFFAGWPVLLPEPGSTSLRECVVSPECAATTSPALPNLSPGDFARQRATTASVASSTSGSFSRSDGGVSRATAISTLPVLVPPKG